jgi:hypothetical protein
LKRSGRDEPKWVVIHMCMEAMIGISLCICLYLKVVQTVCFSYHLLCFLFNKTGNKRVEHVLPRSRGVGQTAQIMYTYVGKCKKNKIKFLKMNKLFEKQSQVLSCTLYASPYIQRMCES